MSVIDYVTINDILRNNIEDRRVFRGCEFDGDQTLLERKFKYKPTINSKHSHYVRYKTIHKEAPVFKYIYLNKQPYELLIQQIEKILTPVTGKFDTGLLKVKQAITGAAEERI
jgi:hypothetical protein